jgi:HD-like signal output (HDOD) protein
VSIHSLFAAPAALPTVPRVVQQLIASFEREDVAIAEIGAQLAADPVLSARTLRLANSAYFHVSRRVETVDDALRLLGFAMVRNLVLGLGAAGAFPHLPGIDLPQFWRHSLHTACGARWLAQAAGGNADQAFTVGLLHGLGHLLMRAALRTELGPLDRRCHVLAAGRAAHEVAALGYHHGEVGAELAVRWKLPETLTGPLRAVPAPLTNDAAAPVAAVVHVAAWRARVDALRQTHEEAEAGCPHPVARRLGLRLQWMREGGTLALTPAHGEPRWMPPLSDLTRGLETMLEPA